jgi:hypothetical protein
MADGSDGMDRAVGRGASRRGFIGGVLLIVGSATMMMPSAGAVLRMPSPLRARRVVVAFHSDQLYLDHSGTAEPYIPPAGLRSLDGLDEEALRHLVYNL